MCCVGERDEYLRYYLLNELTVCGRVDSTTSEVLIDQILLVFLGISDGKRD
jgi:hypothetical protein